MRNGINNLPVLQKGVDYGTNESRSIIDGHCKCYRKPTKTTNGK